MKILIVDDEPKIRKGLCKIVEMHPGWYVPQSFADAESAIAFLRDNGADVVITDIHMPGLTGLDMIEQMRSACPKVVFIILTGYGKFEYAQRAIDLGVKKYLMKPTSPNEITAALEQIEADTPRKKHAAAFQKPTNNLIILRAMEYVDLHYRDRFTLRDMAAALYISPNYLSDLFKKNTGMRLSDYITEVRLEKPGNTSWMSTIRSGTYRPCGHFRPPVLLQRFPEKVWYDPHGVPQRIRLPPV